MARRPFQDVRTMNELFSTAEKLALESGEPKPGAEHLVMAALRLPDGSARRSFERLGADPDGFAEAVTEHHAEALRAAGLEEPDLDGAIPSAGRPKGVFKSTESARKLFKSVVKRIRKEKSQLYGAWFVMEAASTDKGTVPGALRRMGVDPAALAGAARAELEAMGETSGGAW